MSKDITTLLKEATKDLLSEETLKAITEAVEAKAEEKRQLAVEAALVAQDEEYATKLQTVLESIDADHTEKLDKIVARIDEVHSQKFKFALQQIDENHSAKLHKIVKLYENSLDKDAKKFKHNLVEQLSNYIDLYIDKVIPVKTIQEATENTRSNKVINEVKRLVGLSDVFVNKNIKEALVDGKQQIDESAAKISELEKQNKLLTEKTEGFARDIYLTEATANFPKAKKEYMKRVLAEKPMSYIKENFNYVISLYDKKEEGEMDVLKETTVAKTKGVDRVAPAEVVNESHSRGPGDDDEGAAHVASAYVSEFTRKPY